MHQETIDRIRRFSQDRDWDQFHTPANLAKSISIEANELLECFQWSDTDFDLAHVREELADVMVYCQNMLDALGLDADAIINAKMDQNEAKYPVEKCRGRHGRKFCVSDIRQSQEWHCGNRAKIGLNPLRTIIPEVRSGMRASA